VSSVGCGDGRLCVVSGGRVVDGGTSHEVHGHRLVFATTSTTSQLNDAERQNNHQDSCDDNAQNDVEHTTAGVYVP